MAFKRKRSSKKVYIAISLLVILIAASGAIVYSYYSEQNTSVINVTPGVKVGDTFMYSIHGVSELLDLNAMQPPEFVQYNQTDYYKVTITGINGSNVSMDSVWQFTNGTSKLYQQTLNLATGMQTNQNTGFWSLYAPNLKLNDKVRPSGTDGLIVNNTDTKVYADSTRTRNCWSIQNEFYDVTDPTYSTQQRRTTVVYFDKATGILDTLTDVQQYNNPEMNLIITWQLTNSSLWVV
jgi:hypothetical protein